MTSGGWPNDCVVICDQDCDNTVTVCDQGPPGPDAFVPYLELVIANNQIEPQILPFSFTDLTAATLFVELRRITSDGEVVGNFTLNPIYRNFTEAWDISANGPSDDGIGSNSNDGPCGVVFTISDLGVISYISDDMEGSEYVGMMNVKLLGLTI